jgi:hypothetical protein
METNLGLRRSADAAAAGRGALTLFLFRNAITPALTTVAGDLTEANFPGYAAITLAANAWGAASVSAGVATAIFAQQTFTATGSGDAVHGWAIRNAAGELLAVRLLPNGPAPIVNGTTIRITPRIRHGQLT